MERFKLAKRTRGARDGCARARAPGRARPRARRTPGGKIQHAHDNIARQHAYAFALLLRTILSARSAGSRVLYVEMLCASASGSRRAKLWSSISSVWCICLQCCSYFTSGCAYSSSCKRRLIFGLRVGERLRAQARAVPVTSSPPFLFKCRESRL